MGKEMHAVAMQISCQRMSKSSDSRDAWRNFVSSGALNEAMQLKFIKMTSMRQQASKTWNGSEKKRAKWLLGIDDTRWIV